MAGCHTLLICAHPCLSGRLSLPEGSVCSACSVGHSLCLLCWCCRGRCTSVVVFSHGFHGIHRMLGCVVGGVGMAGMPYPPNLCVSVSICGRLSLPEGSVCSACSVGTLSPSALLVHLRQVHQQRVPPESAPSAIGFRSPSDRIASAVRSDCVRRPIGFRSPSDQIPSAARCHK